MGSKYTLPLHDHPSMLVATLALSGEATINTYKKSELSTRGKTL